MSSSSSHVPASSSKARLSGIPGPLDKLYVCAKCNKDFLFRRDVEEHEILTGHNSQENVVIIWLDDVIRLDDFRCNG
jgi:hypothetical protein